MIFLCRNVFHFDNWRLCLSFPNSWFWCQKGNIFNSGSRMKLNTKTIKLISNLPQLCCCTSFYITLQIKESWCPCCREQQLSGFLNFIYFKVYFCLIFLLIFTNWCSILKIKISEHIKFNSTFEKWTTVTFATRMGTRELVAMKMVAWIKNENCSQ